MFDCVFNIIKFKEMLKNICPTSSFYENPENESLFDDNVQIRNRLFHLIESPKFLFFGMPERAKHFFEMNVAQAPQGPMLNSFFSLLPESFSEFIKEKLELVFNPKRESPYSGLHLIKQNLEKDLPDVPVTIIDHPKKEEIFGLLEKEYFPIIGLSIGCENQIPDAEKLVEGINQRYKKWTEMIKFLLNGKNICPDWMRRIPGVEALDSVLKNWASGELKKRFGEKLSVILSNYPELLDNLAPTIVSGNYGASAAKKIFGEKTALNQKNKNTQILWDDIGERKNKRESGLEPFIGEGVHDIRIFLENMGYEILARPNDPIVSKVVAEPNPVSKNPIKKKIMELTGMTVPLTTKVNLNTAVGCKNQCSFCNTASHFQSEKRNLFNNVESMFQSIMEKIEHNKSNPEVLPEICVWILDENMGQNPGAIERMCELVENSGENIRWGTSTDIKSLFEYKKKNGDFRGLLRGGLNSIWLGIESKADVFDKRGDASPEQVEELIKELQGIGISIIGSFIVGLSIHTEGETVMNPDGTYKKLNIYEDMEWCRGLNTAANQVMMYTETILVKGEKAIQEKSYPRQATTIDLLGVKDSEYGHKTVSNKTDISDNKLEEIDKWARREFYQENGPVVLRTIMTLWDGFMALKDSSDPAEQRAAIYNYWMAKRHLHLASLSTVYFSETFFEKCSDKFLERFARFLTEVERVSPQESSLNNNYKIKIPSTTFD